jgi:hemerythrin
MKVNVMALLRWNDAYELGIASIDAQHRELADRVNALEEAVAANSHDAVRRALERLQLFTETHFSHEHELFRQTGYPAADMHIKRHGFLTLILKRFSETICTRRGSAAAELAFLRGWLLDHIGKDDRAFADYMRARFPAQCA